MSDVWGRGSSEGRGQGREHRRGGGTLSCDISRDAFDVSPPPQEQTDACENITFLQLRLRLVTTTGHEVSSSLDIILWRHSIG